MAHACTLGLKVNKFFDDYDDDGDDENKLNITLWLCISVVQIEVFNRKFIQLPNKDLQWVFTYLLFPWNLLKLVVLVDE